jgi:streptogramin lyase
MQVHVVGNGTKEVLQREHYGIDMRKNLSLAPLFALVLASAPFRASGQTITEFALPTGTPVTGLSFGDYGRAITSGPDGNIWLTHTARSSVIRLTPAGEVKEFGLPAAAGGIATGPDRNLWFTQGDRIGRISPEGEALAQFPLRYGKFSVGIAAGPDGNLWFTESVGEHFSPTGALPFPVAVGKITPTGAMTEYPLTPQVGGGAIITGPEGNLWFRWNPLGRTTLAGVVSPIATIPSVNPPVAITLGSDGNVWFASPTDNVLNDTVGYVGKITPGGQATQYALPTSHAYPMDIVAGPDGNLWFTERNANKIGRITSQGVITEFDVPTPDSQPAAICVGPDGNIWFTESKAGKVGRLSLNGPASGKVTLTVPAAASSAGANGTFFHTDLWLMNRSFTSPVVATLTYRCATGLPCGNADQPVTLLPRQSVMLTDVIGRTFGAPSSSGAIEISWPTTSGPVSASSQVSTPLPPAPAFGTLIPALPLSAAKMHAVFIGVASGGSLASGSRSNAGAYNPQPVPVDVTFVLYKGDGTSLGSYARTYQPNEAYQLFPNIFDLLGVGSTAAKDAYLVVTSTAPVFPYVTVIDNVSGLCASDDETAP